MDTYSFISENGTVRQIRDLVAAAKDGEQDVRLDALEQAVGRESYEFGEKITGKTWVDGKPIYRYCGYRENLTNTGADILLTNDVTAAQVNSVVAVGGSCMSADNAFLPLLGYVGSASYRACLVLRQGGIYFLQSSASYRKCYYYIEYTKV